LSEGPALIFDHFDHLDPSVMRDPEGVYRTLRQQRVVASDRYGGFTVLARHPDIRLAAEEWSMFSSQVLSIPGGPGGSAPIMVDPPAHRRYRTVLSKLRSRPAVDSLEPEIGNFVAELIDGLVERRSGEASAALSQPLAVFALARALGLPAEDDDRIRRWADVLVFSERPDPAAGILASRQLSSFFSTVIGAARAGACPESPLAAAWGDDLEGGPLSDEETLNLCVTIVYAALGPVRHLVNGTLLLLAGDDELRRRLREDRACRQPAIDEFLRFLSPVQSIGRIVGQDAERFDHRFRPGERVLLLWGSANRDDGVFPCASRFVVDRAPNPHVAFGAGVHRCPGARLTRIQLRVVLDQVLERMPAYRVDHGRVGWQAGHTCGISRLPIVVL
jgi:cytochrome P450